MKRLFLAGLLALICVCHACDPASERSHGTPDVTRPPGQSLFETPLGPYYTSTPQMDAGTDASSGNPSATPNGDSGQEVDSGATTRLVEESDIFKIEDNLLFLLNRYRGLQIIDLTDLAAPKLVGHVPIYGYPKEMYLRDGVAYILVSDYWNYWWREDGVGNSFYGSQLRLVDVSDPSQPKIIGAIDLEGDCSDSRIVGNALYLVSQRSAFWSNYQSSDSSNETSVISIDLSSPSALKIADQARFPSAAWSEQHLFADERAFIIAAISWGLYDQGWWNGGYKTDLQYVDITDPKGKIVVRDSIEISGRVQERWAMDIHEQSTSDDPSDQTTTRRVLRVVSAENWGNGNVTLTTFDVTHPDEITQLGQTTLQVNEQLKSARFDGDRGYIVTYKNIDPLFAFDLTDPSHPRLLGELEMPGWLDFMVPMGDHIVALGRDEKSQLAISLIDVAGDVPQLLQRISVGNGWGWVPSDADDYAKIFRIFPEIGLIAFPFSHWDGSSYRTTSGVQLIDLNLDANALAERGLIASAGYVERGVLHGETKLLTLSNEIFQAVDISDRRTPKILSSLELARDVRDFALLNDTGLSVQLNGNWSSGELSLTITPRSDPNALLPIGKIAIGAPYGRLFLSGNLAWIVYQEADSNTTWRSRTAIQVVDLSDPTNPTLRGKLLLPDLSSNSYYSYYGGWLWGRGDEMVKVGDSALALYRDVTNNWFVDIAVAMTGMASLTQDSTLSQRSLFLIDLSDPDAPRLASTISLEGSEWAWGLRTQGNKVYLSDYTTALSNDVLVARYHLRPFDVADLDQPHALPKVSIPGWMIGISEGEETIYTYENAWKGEGYQSFLHKLRLREDEAVLKGTLALPSASSDMALFGERAFATYYSYNGNTTTSNDTPTSIGSASSQDTGSAYRLLSIDLSRDAPALTDDIQIPGPGYGRIQVADEGRVFVNNGSGLLVFNLDAQGHPGFDRFIRTQGWIQDIVLDGETAYLPSGCYGVQVVELTQKN